MNFTSSKIFDAEPNVAGPTNSDAVSADTMVYVSVQVVFTDVAAAGTLKLQASNDVKDTSNPGKQFVPTNWNDITGASVVVAAGATSLIPQLLVSYRWIRAVWTRTGGAGTFTASIKSSGG